MKNPDDSWQEVYHNIALRSGVVMQGEIKFYPDQPTPKCERDWILEDEAGQKLLFGTMCSHCNAQGEHLLRGVEDPAQAAILIASIVNRDPDY